ncbi:hypothetical protein [Halocola ammonii]
MKEEELRNRLVKSTEKLILLSQDLVSNSLSGNTKFLIEPNDRTESEHLNEKEIQKLHEFNQLEGQLFDFDETSELLVDEGIVPLWVNSEIVHSTKERTVVKLICSRRLREEGELNNLVSEFPPFQPLFSLPPWFQVGKKFDINWRHQKFKRLWYSLTWKLRHKSMQRQR